MPSIRPRITSWTAIFFAALASVATAQMMELAPTPPPAMEVLISIADQKMAVLQDGGLIQKFPVSTSRFGVGDSNRSYKTPLGNLRVCDKVGDMLMPGAVIKHREATGEVLQVNAPGRDPIVTRILWLEGLEDQNRNARERGIYIHGTPEESRIGLPVSWGCIRMRSQDVVVLYNEIPVGALVSIIADRLPHLRKWEPPKPVYIVVHTPTPAPAPATAVAARAPAVPPSVAVAPFASPAPSHLAISSKPDAVSKSASPKTVDILGSATLPPGAVRVVTNKWPYNDDPVITAVSPAKPTPTGAGAHGKPGAKVPDPIATGPSRHELGSTQIAASGNFDPMKGSILFSGISRPPITAPVKPAPAASPGAHPAWRISATSTESQPTDSAPLDAPALPAAGGGDLFDNPALPPAPPSVEAPKTSDHP